MKRFVLMPLALAACAAPTREARETDAAESAHAATPSGAARTIAPAARAPAGADIGIVQLRDERMTMHASESGPTFTITSTDGRVLGSRLTERELAERHAPLHEVYRSGYAAAEPFLDARADSIEEEGLPGR